MLINPNINHYPHQNLWHHGLEIVHMRLQLKGICPEKKLGIRKRHLTTLYDFKKIHVGSKPPFCLVKIVREFL